ncbi:hypothetical protein BCR44DRAFT_68631 [Catenaria anguillulae PL171]|uniref:Uncharacterized protein n=1 Tax=Catenaria anguillulae PL171 TaxID=765915 RepID=A0A1Y2H5I9_9FUNG|nr:hypothetical protein BCR44DRAFT_68631 [Catenaria anguillulae PL171]
MKPMKALSSSRPFRPAGMAAGQSRVTCQTDGDITTRPIARPPPSPSLSPIEYRVLRSVSAAQSCSSPSTLPPLLRSCTSSLLEPVILARWLASSCRVAHRSNRAARPPWPLPLIEPVDPYSLAHFVKSMAVSASCPRSWPSHVLSWRWSAPEHPSGLRRRGGFRHTRNCCLLMFSLLSLEPTTHNRHATPSFCADRQPRLYPRPFVPPSESSRPLGGQQNNPYCASTPPNKLTTLTMASTTRGQDP